MGFDDSYECSSLEKDTILPFWGFRHVYEPHYYSNTRMIKDSYSETGYSPCTAQERRDSYYFKRTTPVTPLENRFVACLKGSVSYSTYIPLSVEEFYEAKIKEKDDKGGDSFTGLKYGLIAMAILTVITVILLYAFVINSETPVSDAATGIWGLIYLGIPASIYFYFKRRENTADRRISNYLKKHSFSLLPRTEKEELRKEYLAYMIKKYGKEGGGILQEYAKLKGYDRI